MSILRIVAPGLLTTIQDLGRPGYQKHGVSVGGAMDAFALVVANLLVGNDEGAAALEITLTGPTIQFEGATELALTGADMSPTIAGVPVPMWRPVFVPPGSTLESGAAKRGCRAYLAIAGGLDVPPVMGSRSTDLRARIGGLEGRALRAGDGVPSGPNAEPGWLKGSRKQARSRRFHAPDWRVSSAAMPTYSPAPVLGVVPGPQHDEFTPEAWQMMLTQPFQVTPRSDRMGYRLAGPRLWRRTSSELISEAVDAGAVQVTPDGNPILLLADRPPTGGYPKIAHVARVDLPLAAQVRPGDTVRFAEIPLHNSQALLRAREADLRLLAEGIAVNRGQMSERSIE